MLISILHITHTDPSIDARILKAAQAGVAGGYSVASVGISNQAKAIERVQVDQGVSIYTLSRPAWLGGIHNKSSPSEEPRPLEISHGRMNPVKGIFLLLWLFWRVICLANKVRPDCVHVHDAPALPIALVIRLFFRAIIIYDAHELESSKAGGSPFRNRAIFNLEKLCWPYVKGFITVSDAIRDWYTEHFGPPRGYVILNAPKTRQKQLGSEQTLRDQLNLSEETKLFVYVGAFERGRALPELISIFSEIGADCHFALIGDGSIRDELLNLSLSGNNVHIVEPVRHDELVAFLTGADYGFSLIENISLSDYLCLPNKMFEYLNSGITVICSDFPEMSRLVRTHEFGYVVDQENLNAVSELVMKLSKHPRPKTIVSSRIQEFTWQSQANKLRELYSTLGIKKSDEQFPSRKYKRI